jgi:CcmD family protein
VTEFLSENPLYVVLAVVLAIWFGILYYLFRIEKRVAKIEKDISES